MAQNGSDRRVRWLLIGWMFVISAVAYLDRVNISIAGRSLQQEFGLDNIQLGWVFSAFVLGYALFQTSGGRLADRFGPRKVLLFASVWWAVFTTMVALPRAGMAGLIGMVLGLRFLLGVGEATVYPASNRLVASWVPTTERGIANGLIFAGVGAGAGISPPLITYILLNYGWRASFVICAFIGLIVGIVWFIIARDRPAEHPWVDAAELEHIRSGLPAPATQEQRLPWSAILASRNVWALTLSYSTFGYVAYIFFSWFFMYLNAVRGLDLKSSGLYGMLPFLAMATFSTAGGLMSDRLTKRFGKRLGRCGVAGVSMAFASGFLVLGMYAKSPQLASVVLAGGAGFLYVSISSFWSTTADIAGGSAGSVSGFMNMGNQLSGALTSIVTPILARDFGWSVPFLVAAALCGVGALAWLLVDPERTIASDGDPRTVRSTAVRAG